MQINQDIVEQYNKGVILILMRIYKFNLLSQIIQPENVNLVAVNVLLVMVFINFFNNKGPSNL